MSHVAGACCSATDDRNMLLTCSPQNIHRSYFIMWQKIKTYTLAHLLGLSLIAGGWYLSIMNTSADRWQTVKYMSGANLVGLIMIIIGAYLPEIWISIKNRGKAS